MVKPWRELTHPAGNTSTPSFEDARKVLPPNTDFHFISWTEDGKRKTGWVYNLLTPREQQKLFNPLQAPLRT